MRLSFGAALYLSVPIFTLAGCGDRPRIPDISTQAQFFAALHGLCGHAYEGKRSIERPDKELLEGHETLIVHFAQCNEQQVYAPFHIGDPQTGEWDRSRTWIYTLHEDSLELRHDHRLADGTENPDSMYGGFTEDSGEEFRQYFIFTERTGPNDEVLGWRVEVEPGVRYSYGTMADGDWTWRVDFDLTSPVEPPPAAWGYEGGYF